MRSYKPIIETIAKYWKTYGGLKALLGSPYFHLAIVISIINYFSSSWAEWWDVAFALLPSLIGLTLAGYAVMLSVISGKMLAVLSQREDGELVSSFETFNTTFFHFVLIQAGTLMLASVADAFNSYSLLRAISEWLFHGDWPEWLSIANEVGRFGFNFVGALSLYYSVTLIIATLMAVYRIAGVMQVFGEEAGEDG